MASFRRRSAKRSTADGFTRWQQTSTSLHLNYSLYLRWAFKKKHRLSLQWGRRYLYRSKTRLYRLQLDSKVPLCCLSSVRYSATVYQERVSQEQTNRRRREESVRIQWIKQEQDKENSQLCDCVTSARRMKQHRHKVNSHSWASNKKQEIKDFLRSCEETIRWITEEGLNDLKWDVRL